MRDLLVVGGGPAGAATATWAARAGLDVLLVERERFPRHKACAEYLSPEAARDLDDLGVLAEVEERAARLWGFRIVADDGAQARGRFPDDARAYRRYGLALPRAHFDALVLRAARRAGVEVREGVALEALTSEDGVVTGAVLRPAGPPALPGGSRAEGMGRHTERARVVVGADGLNSLVARRLGLARRLGPARVALVAHFAGVEGMSEYGEMFVGRGRYIGLAGLDPDGPGRLVNVAAVVARDAVRGAGLGRDPGAFLRDVVAGFPELERRLRHARLVREVLVAGPFARAARRSVADGALLVGDAADFFDPFTGEGIFAALRGGRLAARAVAAALARGEASAAALAPYRRARRRAFLGKWAFERVAGLAATRPALMRRFARRMASHPAALGRWLGAAGDYVPPVELLAPRSLAALFL